MTTTSIKRGDTVTHDVVFNYREGEPADLSGATITAELVEELDGAKVDDLEIVETDLGAGEFSIVISSEITEELELHKTYYYDALIVHADYTAHTETFALKIIGRATAIPVSP